MPKLDTGAEKMSGHAQRNLDGSLRKIRSDTKIGTLEKRYDVEFPDVRKDMEWGTFKEKFGVSSVKKAVEKFAE